MTVENVSEIALIAGSILLENGAETHRIEGTVSSICESYGLSAECLAMSNGILLSIETSDANKITSMKKVCQKQVDLYRIELINSFSRKLKKNLISYADAKKTLDDIQNSPTFTLPVRTVAACMTGFVYSLFFNGSLLDGIASIFICFITYIILEKVAPFDMSQFFKNYLAGFVIGGTSLLAHMLYSPINQNNVITGSIMILLPGVVLTNGIKDVIFGYFSAGIAKFCEALIIIVAVCAGVITALLI
ncbi:threonine/serine exporter family protein [Clostridium manihotivorum]|uniref:Threonine/serine exporter n=1 Tax=Clostridium manihotivorum TaxID=2320868 RepID=A0A410DVI8_9CLOT|nr:threonine/serine exporter family protein [Clostridium manihotivorum]QAA33071.1 threonine/serine exporter [Clostridium manihotivorum]